MLFTVEVDAGWEGKVEQVGGIGGRYRDDVFDDAVDGTVIGTLEEC